MEIDEAERDHALDRFITKTDYNHSVDPTGKTEVSGQSDTLAKKSKKQSEKERLDKKTADTLKAMREEEMNKHLKDKEDRLKRIHKYHEKKKIKDDAKKKFLSEIEENAKLA